MPANTLAVSRAQILPSKEGAAEFCAEFNKDSNEYSLHLVKNLNMDPDSNWVFPDSVNCSNNMDGPIWNTEYSLNAPHDSSEVELLGGCVALDATPSSDSLCIKPKIVKVNLNPINRDVLHIHKYRAKETLKPYYGKSFKGHWKAQPGGTGFTYEKSFEATIVGPCSKKEIVAEYCIDENHRLVLDKELDYIPRYIFAPASECHFCNKKYRENISTSIAFKKGVFTPIEEMLYKSCEDYSLKESLRLPQNLKKERALYGKVLPVRINAEIQSGESRRKDYYDFKIKISNFKNIAGIGLSGTINKKEIFVGNDKLFKKINIKKMKKNYQKMVIVLFML